MLGNIKNPFKFYSANIEKWSQEILDHWEEIENYTFVFYLQPIDSNYYITSLYSEMHLTPIINMIHWIAKHFNIIKEAIIRILVNMNEIQ